MTSEIGEDSTVSFTVKELLAEQTDLLRGIDHKVDGKADKTDLVPIVAELRDHHTRITNNEDERKAEKGAQATRSKFWNRTWAVIAAVIVPLAVALILVFIR